MAFDDINVHGTRLTHSDPIEIYRQKLARITLDSMVQFVGLLDTQGTVLEINKVALDAVGIKLDEVKGKPFWTTFWWQVSPEINDQLRECIRTAAQGEFVRWDTPIYGRAGGNETIIIDASLMPVRDEQGKVVFIAAEGRDITEKKAYERQITRQREELAKLDELKTEFFANISHEFRTPLTLMLGPLEDALADSGSLSAVNRERLQLTHRNALRQFKLVNTLLDFSRIESGRIQSSYEPANLAKLTEELASIWRSAIERAGMKLTVDCEPLSEAAYVDREMWEKIVLNLISNAFKFTFEGEITVELRQAGSNAKLSIRDTGTGIEPDELPRIFDRFHRIKGARGRSFEGSGIGLALVQELVRLHGGTVQVESQLDQGSCFVVEIPLGKAHLPADRIEAARTLTSTASRAEAYLEEALRWLPDSSQAEMAQQNIEPAVEQFVPSELGSGRVLLVDDNADMRGYVKRLLKQAGYAVQTAEDGNAALEQAREQTPELILSDVMMPGLDGFGLLQAVRADEKLRDVPFILLSARAGEEARIEGAQAGADDYIVKPFGARELLARVNSQLKIARFRNVITHALRESESRFRALALASSDAIYSMNSNWTQMRHLEGRAFIPDTSEPDPQWMSKYIHPEDQQQVQEQIDTAIRQKTTFQLEHRVLRVDGSLGWTSSRAIPVLDAQGNIAEWFGMASDVTERKRLEESLRQADRRKDEFLATLAHELRNPLAPIRNAVHLLKLPQTNELHIRNARDIVDRQVQHMVRLVDDLLDVSRITLGQVTLRRENVSLRTVLTDALEAAQSVIEAARHTLSVELPTDAVRVDGDPTRLSQVFQNILNNAAKYTPAGGRITVTSRATATEVSVSIRDSGIGIPKELQSRVFDLFTRVHTDHWIKTTGLGIGLALAKQLLELHGGRLELRSEGAGAGSEFIVHLPLRAASVSVASKATDETASGPGKGRRILMVDDNKDAAQSMALLLQIEGHEVKIASTGHGALEVFMREHPEIVLLDIGLPDIDGYEVARRIRGTPEGANTLLIALTGWGQLEDKRRAVGAGFDEHLTKPVDPEVLHTLIVSTTT